MLENFRLFHNEELHNLCTLLSFVAVIEYAIRVVSLP